MRYTLEKFTKFLREVNLTEYRTKYKDIKTVEMDLPKNIQALPTMYHVYWDVEDNGPDMPLSFDDFYQKYFNECKTNIELFWNKTGFGKECDCFLKGLKARIYRTWASLITQIHAGYVAETVFGQGSVLMSSNLDHQGIDILVKYKNQDIKIQIKKESKRPEILRMRDEGDIIDNIYQIWYIVPTDNDYNNPRYKIKSRQGEFRDCVKWFIKYNAQNGTLDRLSNGFVVFTKMEFELIKNKIDNGK